MTIVIPWGLSSVVFIASVDLHAQLRQGKKQRRPQICSHVLTCTNTHTRLSAHITQCASPSFHMHSKYTGFSIPATGIIITQLSLSLLWLPFYTSFFFSPWLTLALSLVFSLSNSICNCLSVNFLTSVLFIHRKSIFHFPEILSLNKINLLQKNA